VKWWIRVSVVIGCFIGCFVNMPEIKVASGDVVSKKIRYVALGDSIAYGYGLSDREEQSYVGLIRQYLEQNYDYVFCDNLGTNGLRSEELLDALTSKRNIMYKKYRATLEDADIVSISIGSNDLLHLVELDGDIQKYKEHGDEMFCEACQGFDENFPRIIEEIRKISPSAMILVGNVYNPCQGLQQYEGLYSLAEHYIEMLNKTFTKYRDFTLVDIKGAFDCSEEDLVNMAFKGKEVDPHPSEEGHKVIGSLMIKAIEQQEVGGQK